MKFSCAIMMHPSREKYRDYLISKLGNVPIIMDRGLGIWDTARRAWLNYDKSAQYHLVIQDDVIICKDFYERLDKILVNDTYIYNLYFGFRVKPEMKRIIDEGLKKGYAIVGWLIWGIGIVVPTRMIDEMIQFCDKITLPRLFNTDDTRISKFIEAKGLKVYYPVPSLLNHRMEESSLISGKPNSGRQAYYFIGE